MSLKRFIAPKIAILILLSTFWFAGVDNVFVSDNSAQQNLHKYLQAQRKIVDNYVQPVQIEDLFKSSLKGFVSDIKDSTLVLEDTPLDTSFKELQLKNLREAYARFEDAYLYLSNRYPDENMDQRTEDAIQGMFTELDPHSIYIEPETSERIQEDFAGKFQGIGVQFDIIHDTITVITAISGGPSDQLGIRSGDRIIEINDSSSVGFTQKDVINTLRGPKGTEVDVTIRRPGTKDPLEFTIVRDDIPLRTIDTSYMLDDKTGYIKINRFAATTHEEFVESMKKLRDEGMERMILDLRNNPGGYLNQAIAIAEEFFNKGKKLVSTKSRHSRFTSQYVSRTNGMFSEHPLIILVNEGSASASEIVSGAVQDHDRGLIVGQRSFGKGLVQQQYELVDKSNIRVTISKYYTPSGRLIQKPYKKGRETYAYEIYRRNDDASAEVHNFIEHVPDSLKFTTDAGRVVYGGGGIVPDHIVQEDTTQSGAVANYMRRKRVGFNFVRNFLDENGEEFRAQWEDQYEKFRDEFEWSDQQLATLKENMMQKAMVITDTTDKPVFKSDTLYIPDGHYEEVEWMVAGLTKADLARQVWDLQHYYPVINDVFDNVLKQAMNLWDEVQSLEEYAASHNGSKKSSSDWRQ